jgi:hypothetical protein
MTSRDTLLTCLVRGALTSVSPEPGTEEAVSQARVRTLLPIVRNILFVIAQLAGFGFLEQPAC